MKRILLYSILSGCFSLAWVSCINEDLSGCGKTYGIVYEAERTVDVRGALDEELRGKIAEAMIDTLETVIAPAFEERLADLSLTFFTTDGACESLLEQRADARRYTMQHYLRPDDYKHVAVSVDNRVGHYAVEEADDPERFRLTYAATSDTLTPHMTPAFSGREWLEEATDSVRIPMLLRTAAVALVLRTRDGAPLGEASAYLRETAGGFAHADSSYHFSDAPVIHTDRIDRAAATAFCTTCFPSRTVEIRAADDAESGIWEMDVYIRRTEGGTVTKNTLYLNDPLEAGELEVLFLEVNDEGGIEPTPEVAVGVELDWKPGLDFDLDVEL